MWSNRRRGASLRLPCTRYNTIYSNTEIPAGIVTKEMWSKALRESLTQQHRFHPTLRLTENKIRQLVDDYWKGNPDNRHKSLQDLRKKILYCIKRYDCKCASRHTCQLRNCWSTPHALLEVLQKHFHLEVEGMFSASFDALRDMDLSI